MVNVSGSSAAKSVPALSLSSPSITFSVVTICVGILKISGAFWLRLLTSLSSALILSTISSLLGDSSDSLLILFSVLLGLGLNNFAIGVVNVSLLGVGTAEVSSSLVASTILASFSFC